MKLSVNFEYFNNAESKDFSSVLNKLSIIWTLNLIAGRRHHQHIYRQQIYTVQVVHINNYIYDAGHSTEYIIYNII